jgi:MFS transporter, FSR family, fosmidomycin resistance protein
VTSAATRSTSSLEPKKPITNRASLWAITAAHVTVDMHSGSLVVLLPTLMTGLHLNYASAAAIITVNQIVMAISQPLFGWLGDRQPDATVIWLGCLLAGLGIAGVLWMPSHWAVMAAVMLSGLGAAMFHPEALSRARTLTGGGSAAVGVFFSGGNVGSALGPILATGLIGVFGKPGALLMLAPTALAMIGLGSQWRTIAVIRPKQMRETQTSSERHHYPLIAFLIALIAVRGAAVSGLVNFIPLYFGENRQLDALSAAWLVTITSLAGVFGTLLGGSLADRFGRRLVMTLSVVIEFAAIYGFLHLEGVPRLIAVAIAGGSLTVAWPVVVALMQEAMPSNLGLAAGLSLGTEYAASGLGMVALGVLADRSSVAAVMTALNWLPLLTLALIAFLPQRAVPRTPVVRS